MARELWPSCSIVQGKPRHPQSQGSVERVNLEIKKVLGKKIKLVDVGQMSSYLFFLYIEDHLSILITFHILQRIEDGMIRLGLP